MLSAITRVQLLEGTIVRATFVYCRCIRLSVEARQAEEAYVIAVQVGLPWDIRVAADLV